MVVLEKKYRKQNWEMNIVDIMKIMDKVVENLTRGSWISIDSVKSRNYFEIYGHKIGNMGHIESDNPNSAYMVG